MAHLGFVRDIFEPLSSSRFICPNCYVLSYIMALEFARSLDTLMPSTSLFTLEGV